MVQIEFLDLLYKWKIEAEQELEKLENGFENDLPKDEADKLVEIRNINIENAKKILNRYNLEIKLYLSIHNHI